MLTDQLVCFSRTVHYTKIINALVEMEQMTLYDVKILVKLYHYHVS